MSDRPAFERSSEVGRYFARKIRELPERYADHRWQSTPLRRQQYLQTKETLERWISGRRLGTVLEIGPGPCIWTGLFAACAQRLLAVDLSWPMLADHAGVASNVRMCCGDALALPVGTGTVDALCSVRALEYFPSKDLALAEFSRVLRPGGCLFLVTKNRDYVASRVGEGGGPSSRAIHQGNVRLEELLAMLARASFHVMGVGPVIIGRTRWPAVWTTIRLVRRLLPQAWPDVRGPMRSSVESFWVAARREPHIA